MSEIEKLIEFLKSDEIKEESNRYFKDLLEKQKEVKKELLASSRYIKWLNQFTKDNGNFADNNWLYCPEKISDYNRSNVDKLCLFYEVIEDYASKNYIYPEHCEFGNYYRIKFDGVGFEIGALSGQGTIFFVSRVPLNEENYFIDFNDIMLDKEQENVKNININLEKLSNMIINIYKSGVSLEAISTVINKTMSQITSSLKEDNQGKVLKKDK